MNTNTDFDRIAQTWLQEGPTAIPERALQAALEEVHATRQRRFGTAWRTFSVNSNTLRLATAALVAVLVVAAAVFYLGDFVPSGTVGGTPPVPPTPTATPVFTMTKTFTSVNNGYAVGYPADWTVEPATLLWWPPQMNRDYPGFDRISGPCKTPCQRPYSFRAASAVAPEGVVIDDWIDRYITIAGDDICNPPRTTLPEITIGGHAGRVTTTCPRDVEATVVVGRRAYVFTLVTDYLETPERQAMFDAFLSTIDLRPEGAPAAPTPSPSPS